MSAIPLGASYFAIANPLDWIDDRLHPCRHRRAVTLGDAPIELRWTGRAERALECLDQPLVIEMQLVFSCVVQKRVVFHPLPAFEALAIDAPSIEVDSRLRLCFRPFAAAACDPLEFAARHPAGRELASGAAARMQPRLLQFDYRRDGWQGEFTRGPK